MNLVWLSASLACLAWVYARGRRSRGGVAWRELAVAAVLAAALFPAVSSSDDLFSFGLLGNGLGDRGGFGSSSQEDSQGRAGQQQLARMLQSLEQGWQAHFAPPAPSFVSREDVTQIAVAAIARPVTSRACRAPPNPA